MDFINSFFFEIVTDPIDRLANHVQQAPLNNITNGHGYCFADCIYSHSA